MITMYRIYKNNKPCGALYGNYQTANVDMKKYKQSSTKDKFKIEQIEKST